MQRMRAAVIAAVVAVGIATLGGCGNVAWWGTKKAVKEEAREIGEKVGVIRSKEDLKREIAEQKEECRLKQDELRAKAERQRDECRKKEEELKRKIDELKEEYDRKVQELEKRMEAK